MVENLKKTNRQKVGAHKWIHSSQYGADANGKGCFEYTGGFGKTYVAINFIILPYISKSTVVKRTCTILVPQEPLIKQWQNAISKFIPASLQHLIKIHTVQYCQTNNLSFETSLLVVDELHLFYSAEYLPYILNEKIKFKHCLGLTATYKDPKKRHLKVSEYYPVIDRIDTKTALREGYISKFLEYNLGISLSHADMLLYNEYSHGKDVIDSVTGEMKHKNGISDYISKFGNHGFRGINSVLSGNKRMVDGEEVYYSGFQYAVMWARQNGWTPDCDDDIDALWNPQKIIGYAKNAMNLIRKRKDLLYNNVKKAKVGVEIIKKFNDLKTISFSQSTSFADLFAGECRNAGLTCVTYHTKLASQPLIDPATNEYYKYASGARKGQPKIFGKKKLKDMAIEAFANGDATVMSTASALDVGFNDETISLGIITSRTTNYNKQKQRGFRTTRINPEDIEQQVLIVNIYFINTIDLSWLKKAQSETKTNIYWITSIDEISYNAPIFGVTFD